MIDRTPISTLGDIIADTDPKGSGLKSGVLWTNRQTGAVWAWDDKSNQWLKVIGH